MNKVHLMFDLETLGVKERNTTLLAISVVPFTFGEENNYDQFVSRGFYRKLEVRGQIQSGRTKDQSTIDWWRQQSTEAQKLSFLPSSDDMDLKQALQEMSEYIKKTGYNPKEGFVWSRGIAFDFPKIEHAFDSTGVQIPINLWKARDVRTMIDVMTGSMDGQFRLKNEPANFIKHHSLHDCAHDVFIMKTIFNAAL